MEDMALGSKKLVKHMVGEIASSISEDLPPGFPKKCKREFLLQPTLQRSWTASHSLRYCSDTEESLICYYSMSESYKALFADVGKKALLSNHQDYNDCTCKDTKIPYVCQGD